MLIIEYIAFTCWTIFSLYVILGIIGQLYKTGKSTKKAEVEIIIVSKANKQVKTSLFECIRKNNVYNPTVLVDEESDLISKLENPIIVPKSYRKDLIGKGRAINYFIENYVVDNKWYAFIDDDNLILDDEFLYEIPYYDKKGYVLSNPILEPRKGSNTCTFIMDYIRYFDDLTIFRFFTGALKKPLLGVHGELLCVKGRCLKEIGFGRKSITEDFAFASEIVRRGYKSWQSKTVVSIKSPNTIRDLLLQRGRWFKGIAMDLKYCPLKMKLIVLSRIFVWTFGIFGSYIFFFYWREWQTFYYAIFGGLYFWFVYIFAVLKSRKLYYFFIIPLFGIIECLAVFSALRQKNFEVIDKN